MHKRDNANLALRKTIVAQNKRSYILKVGYTILDLVQTGFILLCDNDGLTVSESETNKREQQSWISKN